MTTEQHFQYLIEDLKVLENKARQKAELLITEADATRAARNMVEDRLNDWKQAPENSKGCA